MLAHLRDGMANRTDALEISGEPLGLARKPLGARRQRGVQPVRQDEWLSEQRASDFLETTDSDERHIRTKAEGAQNRPLWVFGIEAVDFVEGRLDGEGSVSIDCRGSTAMLIALEHQDLVPGTRVQSSGSEPAKSGPDDDGVESSWHRHNPRRQASE
jgi:hypothetical protein